MQASPATFVLAAAITAAAAAGAASAAGQGPLVIAFASLLGGALVVGWSMKMERPPPAPESEAPPARAEQSEEALLSTVMDTVPVALLLYADAGRIAWANQAARELFFEGRPCVGENFLRLVSRAPAMLLLASQDGLVRIDVDGADETFHVARRACPIGDEIHWLLVVRQLTSEMTRTEVDVLKRVIRVISHELNNSLAPVTSLVGSARLIARRPEHADKLDRVLDTIEERATHLGSFVEGYARLARLPAPRAEEVAWAPLLTRIAELYPTLTVPEPPARAGWFDAGQIEQVIINLIKNAFEGPSEAVALEVRLDDHGGATLEVLDRGPGITPEAQKSIFVPFYTTKEKGGGMGLALCREIVHAHGGTITLKNREGGGAVASMWLPGKVPPAASAARSRLTLTRP